MKPGEFLIEDGMIIANANRRHHEAKLGNRRVCTADGCQLPSVLCQKGVKQ